MTTIADQIHDLSRRRTAIWCGGVENPVEVDRITKQLADLYDIKRSEIAQRRGYGTRADIVRRARIESEIERLISTRD